jgi:hypothetical protein
MGRLISLWLAIVLAITVGSASAQSTDKAGSRLYSIAGTAKAVAASSLAVDTDGDVVVIGIDSSTRVVAKEGARARDLLYRKGRPKLSDVIKAGDRVIVICRRADRTPYAVEIRVSKR